MLGNASAPPVAKGIAEPGHKQAGYKQAGYKQALSVAVPAARPASRLRPVAAGREAPSKTPFRSFWMGSFTSRHVAAGFTPQKLEADYRRLGDFQVRTVREQAAWAQVDHGSHCDFSSIEARALTAKQAGIQIVWTLFSTPWPHGIDFLSTAFVERFARYASAIAVRVADISPLTVPVFTPVNELSFQSWALFSAGHVRNRDGSRAPVSEIKRQLVRACIAASDAILRVVPHARLMHTDPLEHVVAPLDRVALASRAEHRNEMQYEGWDLISGKADPGLGGSPRYLDLIGANYYAENQWEIGTGKRLVWQIDDMRRLPLSSLLKSVYARYRRPIAISETGHCGVRRGAWIREVATEVRDAGRMGIALEGICLHPLVDQCDVRQPGKWLLRGLWEVEAGDPNEERLRLSKSYASALRAAQRRLRGPAGQPAPPLRLLASAR